MVKKEYIIINETGVHARPATTLVTLASKFDCSVKLTFQNHTVDLKSIIGVMSLGVYKDEKITISCDGEDEEKALTDLTNLMKDLKLAKELY